MRELELLGQQGAAVGRALLPDADGGGVRQRLRQALVGFGYRVAAVVEQVEPSMNPTRAGPLAAPR